MQRNAIFLCSIVAAGLLLWLVRAAAIVPPAPVGDAQEAAPSKRTLAGPSVVRAGDLPPTAGASPDDAADPVQRQRGRLMKTIARLQARRTALAESEDVSDETLASLDKHVARLQAQVRDLRAR